MDVSCQLNGANANYDDRYERTAPVGSDENGLSPYGAYDMAGNVWEWTSSAYEAYPYQAEIGEEILIEHLFFRVVRGGRLVPQWLLSARRQPPWEQQHQPHCWTALCLLCF